MSWRSKPRWKTDGGALVDCSWLIELAEASHLLLGEHADRHLTSGKSDDA